MDISTEKMRSTCNELNNLIDGYNKLMLKSNMRPRGSKGGLCRSKLKMSY